MEERLTAVEIKVEQLADIVAVNQALLAEFASIKESLNVIANVFGNTKGAYFVFKGIGVVMIALAAFLASVGVLHTWIKGLLS